MAFDEKYLDELLNSIEPIINPEGIRDESDDSIPDVPEEELDSDVAEIEDMEEEPVEETSPLEEVESAEVETLEAPAAENVAEAPAEDMDPNKQLSADEIAAMFAASGNNDPVAEEPAAEEVVEEPVASPLGEVAPAEDMDPNKQLSADEIAAMFAASGNNDPVAEEPAEEAVAEEAAAEPAAPAEDMDPNKQLSADEIAAMFAASGNNDSVEEEPVEEATVEVPAEMDISLDATLAGLAEEASLEEPMADASEDAPAPEPLELDISDGEVDLSAFLNEEPSPEEKLGASAVEELPSGDISLDSLLGDEEPISLDSLMQDEPEPEVQELDMSMSEDEINELLANAKSAGEADTMSSSEDDILATLASAGDEDLGDIQAILNSDENHEAVDEQAFMEATTVEDVASTALETPEERKKREKAEKKAARKNKKKKKGEEAEGGEEATATGEEAVEKQSIFKKIFTMLTESDDDLEEAVKEAEAAEAAAAGAMGGDGDMSVPEAAETGITDENKEILAEIDSEKEEGKKGKKKKKKKKGKKGKEGEEGSEEGADKGEEGEEGEEGKGKKKKKKEKKPKAPKVKEEETPQKPLKKLPKKRVRVTILFMLTMLAVIIVACFGLNKILNLQDARWAFDNRDYTTTYVDLYGLDLKGSDKEIYDKSATILIIDRKLSSYKNYKQLGMEVEALNALIEGVKMYPELHERAVVLGVENDVNDTYLQIIAALGEYGLTEADAQEIAAYESKVKYTRRLQSVANGTPFTYDADIAAPAAAEGEETPAPADDAVSASQNMNDLLEEEKDFLPDDPNKVLE